MQAYRLFMSVCLMLFLAQCTQQQTPAQQVEIHKKVYREALKYSDFIAARTALYNIVVLSPQDSMYKDSLFYLYVQARSAPQAVFLGSELIKKNPNDTTMREMLAVMKKEFAQVNRPYFKEALDDYEILFKTTRDPTFLYQMAELQYKIGRYEECRMSLAQLMNMEDLEKKTVEIVFDQTVQNVPIKAAALNIYGVLALSADQKDEAVSAIQKALEIYPEFHLAKRNLQEIQTIAEKGNK